MAVVVEANNMKYYSAVIKITDRKERAIILKAPSIWEAEKEVKKWHGTFMNITEVVVDPTTLDLLTKKNNVVRLEGR
jgi:hypothetical protein